MRSSWTWVGVAGGAERELLLTGERPALRVPRDVEVVVERVDRRVADVGVDAVLERVASRGVEVEVDDAVGSSSRLGGRVEVAVSSEGVAVDELSPLQAVRPASRAVAASAVAQRVRVIRYLSASAGRACVRGGSAP
jgi:hypothetical protein